MMSDREKRIEAKAAVVRATFGQSDAEDLEAARAIATAALKIYADFDEPTYKRFIEVGIWNDDAAVQSALIAIKMMRAELVPLLAPTRSTHSFG